MKESIAIFIDLPIFNMPIFYPAELVVIESRSGLLLHRILL